MNDICIKCGEIREIDTKCNNCHKIYCREYYKNHKNEMNAYSIQYNIDKVLEIKANKQKYASDNKDIIKIKKKIYRAEKAEQINKQRKEYRKKNKYKILEANRQYKKRRRANDPAFRLHESFSSRINKALHGAKYGESILNYLQYTFEELKTYLKSKFDEHMSWENYGSYWHVDHIYPHSLLPYDSMEHENFKKCWALENLQPLEAIANIKKGNKIVVNYE